MNNELQQTVFGLIEKVDQMITAVNLNGKEKDLKVLESKMTTPDFWQTDGASQVAKKAGDLTNEISFWKKIKNELSDYSLLLNDADESMSLEISRQLVSIENALEKKKLSALLSGEYDSANAILSINAGAGGDDSQDWAEMLLKMYLKFCEKQNWQTNILNQSNGQIAGIKSVTIEVNGFNAFGYLKPEAGVHRLVRLSPFDADHARHTSFAMVEVVPELSEINIEIKDEDLRIDVFRSSGNGGQSVNTTDSAVRITHLHTGIVAVCQNERSQLQNKEKAKQYLYGKLVTYYQAQKEEERLVLRGELTEAAWGNQIRSYVLHPYRMVKDHRTKFETSDPDKVLTGDLLPFIEQYLKNNLNHND